ncbi:diguanylate cyclase [Paenibacillus sp. sgz500958]|uniref:diguanylate cyclase n=1 Tax=Paenibacillus sp. sgz500958 TaxID=3242475 RepID=UPI0036D427B6
MLFIDNYQILETISDNHIKAVYRGKDTHSGETVILKVLKSEYAGHAEVMRFKQEYKLLKELSSSIRGVIKPTKLSELNGYYMMVLEDIEGISLKSILADERPGAEELLRLVVKIVDILGAIHEQNVIHKDIKPSNIIWNRDTDVVQIIDFDLAVKLSKEKPDYQNSAVFEGSLPYISPEQTGRMNRNVDYRSDYYSLGVVLYECMTGIRPFEAEEILDQVYSIIAKEAVSPFVLTGGKISRSLSSIIMKLMEKSSENRYQSSYGIKADLIHCLENSGDFEIGLNDQMNLFRIPQHIYGREAEIDSLVKAFQRSSRGIPQIMMLSGEAGVGKTALVHELFEYINQENSLYAEGKFQQYNQSVPYSALIQALRKLVNQLIGSPDKGYIHKTGNSIRQALDGNGNLLIGMIPELEQWIGVQPELEPLNPAEETNRFFLAFANFLEGITQGDRPLVLFLDDAQWADLASLQLVERLISGNHLRKCFFICSYRQNEIPQGHPLFAIMSKLEKSRVAGHIILEPMTPGDVEQLVTDTLHTENGKVHQLAAIIYKRTKGNSFYVKEILKDLYRNGLLFFDDLLGGWSWNQEEIMQLPINDNVVDFLMIKLKNLPPDVLEVLMLSAAVGSVFDYQMLVMISNHTPKVIAQSIVKAVDEDIIVPLNSSYAILDGISEEANESLPGLRVSFRFQHDRIQQALYQLLDPATSKKLHLTIGRLMLQNMESDALEDKIVDIANHMNQGLDYIVDKVELDEVITLNLRAALKAKQAFGYDSAFKLLEAAIRLLGNTAWDEKAQRTADIYVLYAQCGYLTQHVEAADSACAELLRHIPGKFDRAEIYELQANHYMYLGMMTESISAGKQGLQELGIHIPNKVGMASVLKEFVSIKVALRGKTADDIYEAAEMTDPQMKLIMRLLINFIPPAFISGETSLFGLVVLKKVGLTLKYGNSPESALAFIGYAMLLSGFGDIKGAFEFGRLGIRINGKFNDPKWKGAAYVLYTLFCHPWSEPWDTLQDWFTVSMESSLRSGDLLYLAHSSFYVNLWNPTLDIASSLQDIERSIAIIENTKYRESLATTKLVRQYYLALAGELQDKLSFNDKDFSEIAYLKQLEDAKYYSGIAIYYIYKIKLLFTYESYSEAMEYIDKAYAIIGTLAGAAFMEEFALFTFLNLAGGYKDMNAAEKLRARSRMHKELGRVKKWARSAPDTFKQHEYLMKAEWARIKGKNEAAGKFYDLAIEASERGGFVRYKALTNELAAKFYYGKDYREFAAYLLKQSTYYYSVWGAKGKIRQLYDQYPDIFNKMSTKEFLQGPTITDYSESLDLDSMLMASQAISREIDLNSLLEALMVIVIKNAGAQRGCIIMSASSGLIVEGEYKPDEDKVSVVLHDQPQQAQLPQSILRYVEKSKESLIYNDAFSETQFVNDPYMVKYQPKSLVCMPLMNQNKIIAVIYLENNKITGAFTKERMKIINLLSREMVFSLENASLYSDLERSEEKYRTLVNNLQDGIFITQNKKCVYVNEALAAMLGYEMDEMIGMPFEKFVSPTEREKVMHFYNRRFDGKSVPGEYETRLIHKDQVREIIVIHKVTLINYLDTPAIQGTVKDITIRKQAEEELRRHKEHLEELVTERTRELEMNNEELNKYIKLIEQISITDELTGLYNRRYFNKVFQEKVEEAVREGGELTYLMLDIDYFKKYNDTYGHYEGDNVLREFGKMLWDVAGQEDRFVFRLGGEEFGMIIPEISPKQSFEYAEGLRKSIEDLRLPHEMSTEYGIITVSVGIAAVKVHNLREEDIYKLADDALYQSKASGRNRVTMIVKE